MKSLKSNFGTKLFIIVGAFILLSACDSRPKGVLSKNDMVNILADLHTLDGSMAAKGLHYNEFDLKNEYYISVLDKYKITQAQFDSSLVWYSKNPKNFDKIYDKVIEHA
ncbi:MAG: DUF4296 domain-containing protein [Paludibacter sp.]